MAEDDDNTLAEAIKEKKWWQGSILPSSYFDDELSKKEADAWWVIASQTCNLYNSDFEKVPVFEMVLAKKIDKIDARLSKGNNPRKLHIKVEVNNNETIAFEVDIQKRVWVDRKMLATLVPYYQIRDANQEETADWLNNQWLDNFAGWLSRSYTRVTLPDEFNDILRASKIQPVLDNKLGDNKLYGIYFNISSAEDEEYAGPLGLMPPPYSLEISLVSDEKHDPTQFVEKLKKQLFEDKVTVTFDERTENLTRAAAAKKLGLTIILQGITGQSIGEVSLLEVKKLIRYTLNDYLSRAGVESE